MTGLYINHQVFHHYICKCSCDKICISVLYLCAKCIFSITSGQPIKKSMKIILNCETLVHIFLKRYIKSRNDC